MSNRNLRLWALLLALAASPAQCASLEDFINQALAFVKADRPGYTRALTFSGLRWRVKEYAEAVGPGPNFFSGGKKNVWVDDQGRLHLRVSNEGGQWRCAEVVSEKSLGYGTYKFTLDALPGDLDPSAVLGLFTWSDDPAEHNREIDIEFARWGQAANQDAQFVVQPYDDPRGIKRFDGPKGTGASTHSFSWRPSQVDFESAAAGRPLARWSALHNIPHPGGENVRMNLWLFRGAPPSNLKPVEVVISRFEFIP